MKPLFIGLFTFVLLQSCSTKKQLFYLQDVGDSENSMFAFSEPLIQPNDILNISVGALVPETVIPYNKSTSGGGNSSSIESMKLNGYLVSQELTIKFPQLGEISVSQKTTSQLEEYLKNKLIAEGHLNTPTVTVRLLNSKFTILGEVNTPGTFNYSENRLTLLQAIGIAGDLSLYGRRDNIVMIREINSKRIVTNIDLTKSTWLQTEWNYIRPNDVIIVNPSEPKVKSAGFIGNLGTLISVISILLSTTLLLTR